MRLSAAPWENPPGRWLPWVTQICSRPDPAPSEAAGRQGTAKPRNLIPGVHSPCQNNGRDGVRLSRHPRVPCGEGLRLGPKAGQRGCPGAAGTSCAGEGLSRGIPSPRSASGMRRVEGWAGGSVRAQRLQVVGHGPSAGGAAALTRSFLPARAPGAQGQGGPTTEGPRPEPPLPAQTHLN